MKENYPIYLPYQFHWRPQSALGDPQLPNKKMKTPFLSNMSKSRRLTSTFFPITCWSYQKCKKLKKNLSSFSAFDLIIIPSPYRGGGGNKIYAWPQMRGFPSNQFQFLSRPFFLKVFCRSENIHL